MPEKFSLALLLLLLFHQVNPASHSTIVASPVPYSKSGIVPRSSLLGAGQLGFWGSWKGWENWVKGGANRVSLQAT